MTTTWILAAHRSGATVYEHTTPGSLALVREFPHPEGRMKNRELGDDRPGRSYESGGVQRSSVGSDHVPVRDIAESFAAAVSQVCRNGTWQAYAWNPVDPAACCAGDFAGCEG